MLFLWDLDSNRLIKAVGSSAAQPGVEFKTRLYHTIQIQFLEDGEPVELTDPTITFGIKLKGIFDGGFLISSTAFVWDATDELYEATIFFGNDSLYAAINDNSDLTDDENSIDCLAEFQYVLDAAPTEVICHQGLLIVTIVNKLIHGSETPAGETPALFQVTNEALLVYCPDGTWRQLPLFAIP